LGRQLGSLWQGYLLPRLLTTGILKRRGAADSGEVGIPFPLFGVLVLLMVASILALAVVFLVPSGVAPYP
jgi:hypothetical protein